MVSRPLGLGRTIVFFTCLNSICEAIITKIKIASFAIPAILVIFRLHFTVNIYYDYLIKAKVTSIKLAFADLRWDLNCYKIREDFFYFKGMPI